MGINHIKPHQQSTIPINQYHQIPPQQHCRRSTYGTFTTHQHNLTQQKIDKHTLQFSSKKQQQNYYQCYLQRYRQEYIVNTLDYIDLSKNQFCSHLYRAEVYIQHIPVRLVDIIDIPYPDNLYIFRNCMFGFGLLYNMIGYFQVQEDHICINSYGEVKVWLNNDLSKNYPEDYNQQIKSECDMVHKILTLLENNTNIQQCPIQLSEYFIKKHKKYPNFSQAIQLLDQYVTQYKTIIPKYCESIFELFKDTKGSVDGQEVTLQDMYNNGPSNTQRINTNMGTVQLNQEEPIVPMLDMGGIGQRQQIKEDDGLRDTIKKETNLYGGRYRFYQTQRPIQKQTPTPAPSQKTQRIDYNSSQRTSFHSNIIHSYNRIQTKRTPIRQSLVYKITSQIIRPIVHFTYNSPQQNIISPHYQYYSHPHHVRGYTQNIPIYGVPMKIDKPISVPYITKQIPSGQSSTDNILMKSNADAKVNQITNFPNANINNLNINIQPNNTTFNTQKPTKTDKKRQKQEDRPKKHGIEEIQNRKVHQNSKTSQKNEKNLSKQKNLKPYIFYYNVQTGSEEIDPQIAADLIKYL